MFKWALLWLGGLAFALKLVMTLEPDNEGSIHFLSHLLRDEVLDPYSNECEANIINGGFLTLQNGPDVIVDNYTVSSPNLFISCANGSEPTLNDSLILREITSALNTLSVVYDVDDFLTKDPFEDSVIMITFASCAVCIGTWMVYLVLLLLPSDRQFSKSFLVPCYVLFSAIYDTAMLVKAVHNIFEKQYQENLQDSSVYENYIINGVAFKVGDIICNILLYLNWTTIIFYMFHDNRKISMGWLPSMFSDRNRLIVYVGIGFTVIDTVLYAALHWYKALALRICYKVIDFTIYTLFCGYTAFFVWHDFRFILAPQRMHTTGEIRIKTILLLIWNDYHETIPLIVYNIALFTLLYFTTIYFTIDYPFSHKWKFKVVKFLKLIITVSVWGLINVLEKRELTLSKETVLGRKINNNDEYFFDPNLPCRHRSVDPEVEDDDFGSRFSKLHTGETVSGPKDPLKPPSWQDTFFNYPVRVWKSHMERPKNLRKSNRTKRKKFLKALVDLSPTGRTYHEGTDISATGSREEILHTRRFQAQQDEVLVPTENVGSSVDTTLGTVNANFDSNDECASAETQLARNYIYDYDNAA